MFGFMKRKKIEIRKMFEFEAAHHLPKHDGLCRNPHGHGYKLAISITGKIDPHQGMVMDFSDFKKIVEKNIIKELDHKDLNKICVFDPTAENLANWIWDKLKSLGLNVSKVELWETSGSSAIISLE